MGTIGSNPILLAKERKTLLSFFFACLAALRKKEIRKKKVLYFCQYTLITYCVNMTDPLNPNHFDKTFKECSNTDQNASHDTFKAKKVDYIYTPLSISLRIVISVNLGYDICTESQFL